MGREGGAEMAGAACQRATAGGATGSVGASFRAANASARSTIEFALCRNQEEDPALIKNVDERW